LAIAVLGILSGIFLINKPTFLNSFAKNPTVIAACSVPKGVYQTTVNGDGVLDWKIRCKGGLNKNGTLKLAESVSLGKMVLPQRVSKGDKIQGSISLSQFCKPVSAQDYKNLCSVCKIINCDNIKVAVNIVAEDLICNTPRYNISGNGEVSLSAENVPYLVGTNTCSLYGSAKGKFKADLRASKKTEPEICIQVITRACDSNTKKCQDFPTPCDIPDGWLAQ